VNQAIREWIEMLAGAYGKGTVAYFCRSSTHPQILIAHSISGKYWSMLSLLALASFVLHLPHFQKDVMGMHAWRQAQTQTNTDSFVNESNNILQPRRNDRGTGDGIFRMEFPLAQWSLAQIQRAAGGRPVIMRSFYFVLSLLTLLGLFYWVKSILGDPLWAAGAAWAMAFSPTFFYHSFNPMPDNMALCAGVWGLAFIQRAIRRKPKTGREAHPIWYWALASAFLAVATLCKLPFILYYAIPAGWFLSQIRREGLPKLILPMGVLALGLLFPTAWYSLVIPEWQGNNIVGGVLSVDYGWRRLFDYFQHNLVSTLPELLLNFAAVPAFLFGAYSAWQKRRLLYANYAYLLLFAIGLIVFFFYELHALGKAHDYYLYPYLPVLFLVVAYGIKEWWCYRRLRYLLPALLFLAPVFCLLRLNSAWNPEEPGFNTDLYQYKVTLREAVPDDALVIAAVDPSPFIYLYHLQKKGWVLHNDELTEERFWEMIEAGATYLYSDSRTLEAKAWLKPFLKEKVMEQGSFRVYHIK